MSTNIVVATIRPGPLHDFFSQGAFKLPILDASTFAPTTN